MRTLIATVIVAIGARAGLGAGQVFFADPNLKAAVETTLWVWDPTPADMLALTSLSAGFVGVRDLTGLEQATNLQYLDLQHSEISDLSALSGLGSLQTLRLNTNRISDVTPLAGLTTLETLDMHDNRISDLSALAGLTNLRSLTLLTNQISDLSGLAGLATLQTLRLDNNRIRSLSALSGLFELQTLTASVNSIDDISALAGLTNLEYVNLYSNEIADISALGGLSRLRHLSLSANRIADIAALATLRSFDYVDLRGNPLNQDAYGLYLPQIMAGNPGVDLKYNPAGRFRVSISATAGGSVIQPGEGQFMYDEGQMLYLEARPDACHAFAGWSGSFSSVANPVSLSVHQDHVVEAVFVSVCDTIYVDDDAIADPGPGAAGVSDPAEDGTIEHPFDAIQEAIDAAFDGATVVVRPGVYREIVNLRGKNIELTGLDPDGPPLADLPVIDGGGAGPVVSFTGGEDPNCMVVGFVITGGRSQEAAAILCTQSSPVIAHCLIVGNRTTGSQGASVRCLDSQATFVNCTLADNIGGGIILSDSCVVLTNSILWGNGLEEMRLAGASKPAITYSDVAGSWPDRGNIDADPRFARRGYWAEPDDMDPVWMAGDYHLSSRAGRWDPDRRLWVRDEASSPCLDAGDPAGPVGLEPVPNGGVINLGAYGGTAQASKSEE